MKTKHPSVQALKAMHAIHRPDLVAKLMSHTKEELIKDFFVELNAKTKAYYFILDSEYLDEFAQYCNKHYSSESPIDGYAITTEKEEPLNDLLMQNNLTLTRELIRSYEVNKRLKMKINRLKKSINV